MSNVTLHPNSKPKAELLETIGLVRAVRRFVGNYERFAPETGYIGGKRRAVKRLENALIDCLRVAIEELHEGNKGDRIRAIEAEIATLENHHSIDEPIMASPKIQSLAENFLREGSREITWGPAA